MLLEIQWPISFCEQNLIDTGRKKNPHKHKPCFHEQNNEKNNVFGVCDGICLTRPYYSKPDLLSTENVKFSTYLEAKSQCFAQFRATEDEALKSQSLKRVFSNEISFYAITALPSQELTTRRTHARTHAQMWMLTADVRAHPHGYRHARTCDRVQLVVSTLSSQETVVN